MGPAKPSSAEEDAFMNDLLSGINDSFFDAVPTPDPSPAKPPPPQSHAPIAHSVLTTPTKPRKIRRYTPSPVKRRVTSPAIGKSFVVGDLDVEDAAGWDWDAISDYVPTPKKPPSSKQKVPLPVDEDEYEPEPCTRCIILAIEDVWVGDNFEKVRTFFTWKCSLYRLALSTWSRTLILPRNVDLSYFGTTGSTRIFTSATSSTSSVLS
ncbi:hypothetical protein FA95DRAFT_90910 [Auriscalpium vulgare]|uniref:Uncharacterized protein n=1 Tax=Auriscalpium vulgare TaxID=40419 RepID=A0ACB8RQG1_9AGAM|nr:hypothetical protein FA95DRAFT_90910 [Auriscalpium vulgare]